MASTSQAIDTWTNPLPGSVSTELGIIFDSLTTWLQNPTFINGLTVGTGAGPTINPADGTVTTPAPQVPMGGTNNPAVVNTIQVFPDNSGIATVASPNYVAGSTGWAIRGDGSAEFSNVVVRGSTFSGTITSSVFDTALDSNSHHV